MMTLEGLQKIDLVVFHMTAGMIAEGMTVADELEVGMPTPGILDYAWEMKGEVLHDEADQPNDNDDGTWILEH